MEKNCSYVNTELWKTVVLLRPSYRKTKLERKTELREEQNTETSDLSCRVASFCQQPKKPCTLRVHLGSISSSFYEQLTGQ